MTLAAISRGLGHREERQLAVGREHGRTQRLQMAQVFIGGIVRLLAWRIRLRRRFRVRRHRRFVLSRSCSSLAADGRSADGECSADRAAEKDSSVR